jgi:hypothetical protein
MSFSDFTPDALRTMFALTFQEAPLFSSPGSVEPTPWLKEALEKGQELAFVSEKSRSEFIVAPVLIACREMFQRGFHVFSGVRLDVEPERGLKGECDFILARTPSAYVLQAPLFVILEAKKNDIEEGLGQCAAQMYAARLFNDRDRTPTPFVYGCVTTGEAWQFLKLQENNVIIDDRRYYINELGKILWALSEIIKSFPNVPSTEAA